MNMQALRSTIGKVEAHARAVAIGVTAVIALGALAWPYVTSSVRSYLVETGMPQPKLVLKPGYQVLLNGHPTSILGTDECPQDVDPQKAFWLGGRPDDIPTMGCVVVGPETPEVRVMVSPNLAEVWKVVHEQRDGFPVTRIQRPNGDYIADAK